MPGFGFVELCAIFLFALILFGPKDLPQLARALARLFYEMKNIFRRLEEEWKLTEPNQTPPSSKSSSSAPNKTSSLESKQE